jgi:hypothetical protein
MTTEDKINNSYEILDLFERSRENLALSFYHPSRVTCKTFHDQRPGKCKCYTKKEIALYVLRLFQNKTVLEGR